MSDYRMNLNQSLSSLKTGKGRNLSNGPANGYDAARREHGRDFRDGKEIMPFIAMRLNPDRNQALNKAMAASTALPASAA